MEWFSAIRRSVKFIEEHLGESISAQDAAREIGLSPMTFQNGFRIVTGYSVAEYIRNRRLYLAAQELKNRDAKVIDIALECGYETPEAFTKAFTRFHGATPAAVRSGAAFRPFLPLTIQIDVSGGDKMDVKITNLFGFKVIGFPRMFDYETAQAEIPAFWDEICEKYAANVYAGKPPANACEKAIADNCIGEYGVCIDDEALAGKGKFCYLVAGRYTGGEVPEGMMLYEFPRGEWAIFDCFGPIPEALQALNNRIFKEWLPGNPDFEISGSANVEWYDCINGEKTDPDYHSAIWVPVRKK